MSAEYSYYGIRYFVIAKNFFKEPEPGKGPEYVRWDL